MKRIVVCSLLLGIMFVNSKQSSGQVTVGSNAIPDISSVLDLRSGGLKGLLLPRVTDTNAVLNRANGLLVYTTSDSKICYFDGSYWKQISAGNTGNSFWSLSGNASTNPATNFLGTTDNVAFNIRVNNEAAGKIDPTGPVFLGYQAGKNNSSPTNTGIGYNSLLVNSSGYSNTALGYQSLMSNITGWGNTAIGSGSLKLNTGNTNTSVGHGSLSINTTGGTNSAFGYSALSWNTTGAANTALGHSVLNQNSTGRSNTGSGNSALTLNETGSYNSAYGARALVQMVSGSNNSALGYSAGGNATGSGNVFIGYRAGEDEAGSNKLYIANSNTTTPLIYGDFSIPKVAINGGVALSVNKVSTNYTVAASDYTIINTGGAVTFTLPGAVTANTGQVYILVNAGTGDISVNNIVITVASGPTLQTISSGNRMTIQSDGTNWFRVQ